MKNYSKSNITSRDLISLFSRFGFVPPKMRIAKASHKIGNIPGNLNRNMNIKGGVNFKFENGGDCLYNCDLGKKILFFPYSFCVISWRGRELYYNQSVNFNDLKQIITL